MKYYLEIDSTVFSNVSKLEISGKHRMESVQTNLAGDYVVDRIGNEKLKLSATLNLLTDEEMQVLRDAKDAISCDMTFYRGETLITKSMRILDFTEPSPIYFNGSMSKGLRYGKLTINAEEM
ncbi:MAG: hypothetical protein K2N06_05515 [Oscillospiraceae bacterium]|nr:hypothetical protein [Oscillospiraceae bacterium]